LDDLFFVGSSLAFSFSFDFLPLLGDLSSLYIVFSFDFLLLLFSGDLVSLLSERSLLLLFSLVFITSLDDLGFFSFRLLFSRASCLSDLS